MGAAIAVGDREFGVGHLLAGGAGCRAIGREGVGSAEIGGFNQVRSFMAERRSAWGGFAEEGGSEEEGRGGGVDTTHGARRCWCLGRL